LTKLSDSYDLQNCITDKNKKKEAKLR